MQKSGHSQDPITIITVCIQLLPYFYTALFWGLNTFELNHSKGSYFHFCLHARGFGWIRI